VTAADEQNSGLSDTALLEEEAFTDESSYDKLMLRGNITAVPAAIAGHQKDWEGLTHEEEAARKHKDQEDREEYERAMEQVRARSEELMRRLDEQEREVQKKLAEADSRAIVLRDGRRVFVGKNGDYIEEASGRKLDGADKTEAAGKRQANSETEEEHKALKDQLARINEARNHLRKADELAANGKELSPDERKENADQARSELAVAEATAQNIAYVDVGANDDMAGALGLGDGKAERSPSFAATLEDRDSRSIALQNDFTASAQPAIATTATKSPEFAAPPVSKNPAVAPS
jgi:hypothetical protein